MNTDQDSTRQLPYNPVSALPSAAVSGSAASCQLCGERLRGQIWEWGSYETLCGLCVDDLMNKDYKARHDMAMKKQKPPNDPDQRPGRQPQA